MPNYKGHLVGGAVGFGAVVFLCSLQGASCGNLLEWLVCVLAGSLFPDIDTKSKGQKLFYIFLCGVMLLCVFHKQFKILAACAFAGMLPLLSKHRGIFHHFWFIVGLVIITVICLSNLYPYAYKRIVYDAGFFIVGVMSHLYLDVGVRRMLRLS